MAQPLGDVRITPSLRDFTKQLRQIDRELPKEVRSTNKVAADLVAGTAASMASSYGPLAARAGSRIKGVAETIRAKVRVTSTKSIPYAIGALTGAKQDVPRQISRGGTSYTIRGWNQLPPWIGTQWEPGAPGSGPRAIGPAFSRHREELAELYGDALARIARVAFGR